MNKIYKYCFVSKDVAPGVFLPSQGITQVSSCKTARGMEEIPGFQAEEVSGYAQNGDKKGERKEEKERKKGKEIRKGK